MIPKKLIQIYKEANAFLLTKVDKKVLKRALDYYHSYQAKNLHFIFRRLCISLINKQGYVNYIADPDDMRKILMGFDHTALLKKYDSNWEKLFKDLEKKYGRSYKMDPTNKRNAWVMYSKGILSCAKFLSNFKSLKDFDRFVRSFFENEFSTAALPMLLEKEIYGFGFAIACDFLKELGYPQYGKPDVHLKDIFEELSIVTERSDYEVFKQIVRIANLTKEDPVIVDKIFWLIGSGNFHESGIKIGRQKENFYKYIKSKNL